MTDLNLGTSSQVKSPWHKPRGLGADHERNAAIINFYRKKNRKWSYQLIADHFGISRNVVAGILFRERHPPETLVKSAHSRSRNKTGGGRKPTSYYPEKHARNTR